MRKRKYITKHKKVQVGKDQENVQPEKDSHSKNRDGKKTKLTIRYLYHENVHGYCVYMPHSIVHNAKCRGFQRTRKPVNIWYNNIYFLIYIVTIINRWMKMADDNMPSVNYNQSQSNTIKALRQS